MKTIELVTNYPYLSLRAHNKFLHSPYNAPREAERIITQQISITSPLMIIVIEPGIGYVLSALRKNYPEAILVAVHFITTLRKLCRWSADYHWERPEKEQDTTEASLRTYFFSCIEQLPSPRIAVVIPPYATDIACQELKIFKHVITNTIQKIRSNIATVGYFGKTWIKNSIANTLFIKEFIPPSTFPAHCPVCIVGSGPTLNEMVATLKEIQQHALIIALPSALLFLKTHAIAVDMIVNTDGGFWATVHTKPHQRDGRMPPVAMPLTAAKPFAHRIDNTHTTLVSPPTFLFNQQFCLEAELSALIDPRIPKISTHGTVAANAIEISLLLRAQQVLLFGIDGAYINGLLHCWPHSFGSYYTREDAVMKPSEQQLFTRLIQAPIKHTETESNNRISHAHAVYQQELRMLINRLSIPVRAVSLPHYTVDIGIPTISRNDAIKGLHAANKKANAHQYKNRNTPGTTTHERITQFRTHAHSANRYLKSAHPHSNRHTYKKKQQAVMALLYEYQQRIKKAEHTRENWRDQGLFTLINSLAPQQFQRFWKTRTPDAWRNLREQCTFVLQNLIDRYQ